MRNSMLCNDQAVILGEFGFLHGVSAFVGMCDNFMSLYAFKKIIKT